MFKLYILIIKQNLFHNHYVYSSPFTSETGVVGEVCVIVLYFGFRPKQQIGFSNYSLNLSLYIDPCEGFGVTCCQGATEQD